MSFVSCVGEGKSCYFDNNCTECLESVKKFLAPKNVMWRIDNHA